MPAFNTASVGGIRAVGVASSGGEAPRGGSIAWRSMRADLAGDADNFISPEATASSRGERRPHHP